MSVATCAHHADVSQAVALSNNWLRALLMSGQVGSMTVLFF